MICRDGVTLAAGTSHGTDLTLVEKPRGSPSLVSPGALEAPGPSLRSGMANHGTCSDPTVWYSKCKTKGVPAK